MRVAVQLYTLRESLQKDLEPTLAALADAGAEEVELAGFYDRTPGDPYNLDPSGDGFACSSLPSRGE